MKKMAKTAQWTHAEKMEITGHGCCHEGGMVRHGTMAKISGLLLMAFGTVLSGYGSGRLSLSNPLILSGLTLLILGFMALVK